MASTGHRASGIGSKKADKWGSHGGLPFYCNVPFISLASDSHARLDELSSHKLWYRHSY